MKKTSQLKTMLANPGVDFILEAHNGISAKIVEEAGFKGIWASGLSLSAQYGVRDSNEASWTQVLEMVEFMADATSIPILLDGDTGYGNFNNFRRLIRKLEQRDVAGVCIEDKIFPKTNSFIDGKSQRLADIDEFCGKIKAGKDSQLDDDFVIVARVEAFIAGLGLAEAIRRAEAYRQAGADAILIHSALNRPDEVLAFKKEWGDRHPVVIVPTKYYSTPTDVFRDYDFSLVIWANHLIRTSVRHMQNTAASIYQSQNLMSVEDKIAPVRELFRLQGVEELSQAEKSYLPQVSSKTSAVVLAASQGSGLGGLTKDCPKALLNVSGKKILQRIVDTYSDFGIQDIHVIRGYGKEQFKILGVTYHDNDDYATTGEFESLSTYMRKNLLSAQNDLIVSYGDVMFTQSLLMQLDQIDDAISVIVDPDFRRKTIVDKQADFALASKPYSRKVLFEKIYLNEIATTEKTGMTGEWVGLLKIPAVKQAEFMSYYNAFSQQADSNTDSMVEFINYMITQGESIRTLYNTGGWIDVDVMEDLIYADELT